MGKAVALITGAGRGIGRGIAITLAGHGYDIVVNDIEGDPADSTSGLYEVKQRVEEVGQQCLALVGDVADRADQARMLDEAFRTFGSVDLLVNNAGVAPSRRLDILETTPESYDRVMNTNLRGPFFLTQAVAKRMIKQVEAGASYAPKIIFITSISSETASPNRAEYCVSKAGLSMVAQNFAVRLAPYEISVYDLRPGIIETPMTSGVREKYDRLIDQGLLLQNRWGTPEDIGKAVAAIAEGYLDYSTGAVIEIGGGFGVRRL